MKKILGSLLLLLLCLPLMAQKADGKQKMNVKKLYSLYGEAYDSFTRLDLPAKTILWYMMPRLLYCQKVP